MNNPLVSVITVCLNSEKTIERAIKSVLNQNYSPIEYIILDGGSNDNTLDIINKYKNNISKIISEKDNGISDAFNKGIKLSSGKYIQLLNSDDVLDENKIYNSVKILEENQNYAFCYGDIKKSVKNKIIEINGIKKYKNKLIYVMPKVNHPTFLVSRNIYDNYGYFEEKYKIAMDYDWLLKITKNGESGIYSNKIKVFVEGGGVSDDKAFLAFRECREISIKYGLNNYFANLYYCLRYLKQILYKIIGTR